MGALTVFLVGHYKNCYEQFNKLDSFMRSTVVLNVPVVKLSIIAVLLFLLIFFDVC